MKIIPNVQENVKKGIIAIGQNIIEKADEITKDLTNVTNITIHAEINPGEIVNFDIVKKYSAEFKEEK